MYELLHLFHLRQSIKLVRCLICILINNTTQRYRSGLFSILQFFY